MRKALKTSEINHLRRLLGWVRCEIPPEPGEVVSIVKSIAPAIDSEDAKQKMVEWHREAQSVPKYVRAALKALAPLVREAEGETVTGENVSRHRLEHQPLRLDAAEGKEK